jgi:hypothetical protein
MAFSDFGHVGSFWCGYRSGFASGLVIFRSSVAAFYLWLLCLFYSVAAPVRRNRLLRFRLLRRIRFEVEEIVHWMPEILLAAEID